MKVQVNVKSLAGEALTLGLTVGADDTVEMIKDRVALAEPNPFPDRALLFDGRALKDGAKLSECGVEDGDVFDFQTRATEEALVKQFAELLTSKGWLPIEELGLLYTLKHGLTAGSALQALGKHDLLQDFLGSAGKHFILNEGQVKLASDPPKEGVAQTGPAQPLERIPEDAAVQKLEVTVSVTLKLPSRVLQSSSVSLKVDGADTVGSVKQTVCALSQIPFAEAELSLQGKALLDGELLVKCGASNSANLDFVAYGSEEAFAGQLVSILQATGPSSRMDLDNMYCCRHGVSASDALQMLGWGEKLLPFLQRHPLFSVKSGCILLAQSIAPSPSSRSSSENQPFLDLHAKLSASDFSVQLSQSLDLLKAVLSESTFLNVRRALRGGAVAKGTAIPGAAGAEVVLFLEGLPPAKQDGWLRGLASAVSGALGECVDELAGSGVVGACAAGGVVRVRTAGPLGDVSVFFAPDYGSYSEAVAAMRSQDTSTRRVAGAALVAQKVRFVEKQPEGVKATMRLLKWWREQRQWTSDMTRPSDELLELVVAHTVNQSAPRDLCMAVSNVLSVLARFDELKVTWPLSLRCYREDDILKPLLTQRPLVLDPANPLVNVADSQSFWSEELMAHARAGNFFL